MFAIFVVDGHMARFSRDKISNRIQNWLYDYRIFEAMSSERIAYRDSRHLSWNSRKKNRKWIIENSNIADILICVGKSHGATTLLNDILVDKKVSDSLLFYDAVGLFTIDPKFAISSKLKGCTFNLDEYQFKLPQYINCAVNVYANKRGALVEHADNIPIRSPELPNDYLLQQFLQMIVTLKHCRQMMRDGEYEL